jgi:hypothetical protein
METTSELGPTTLPPTVNAVAEREIQVTAPVPSETFGLPETVMSILNPILGYIYSYVKQRIMLFIGRRLAVVAYGQLSESQRMSVNEKRQFIEETYNHIKERIEQAFSGADEATRGYVPEILVYMLHSVQHGFEIVNTEIDNQLINVGTLGVKATGAMLNFLFTSDLTIKQVGWRKGPPMSARVLAVYGDYWRQATGITSNLISGLAFSDAIDTIQMEIPIKQKAELLYKMTHPEEFGARPDQVPTRHRKPYLLLNPEEIQDILKITLVAKANNRNYEGSEEVFNRPLADIARNTSLSEERIVFLKRLFFGIREKGAIHFFYKFDPGFLHHGVILTGGLCVEVQNRVFNPDASTTKRVRAVVTPSSILDMLQRSKKVGLYAFDYDDGFADDVVRARALWTIGKWDYSLFYNNCEHHTTWVFGNKLASEQCERMETAVRTLGERDPRVRNINAEQAPEWLRALRNPPAVNAPPPPPPPPAPAPLPPLAVAVAVRPVVRQAAVPGYMRSTAASRLQALPKGAKTTNVARAFYGNRLGGGKTRKHKDKDKERA